MQGPYVKKLIIHKMSLLAISNGGGLAACITFLSNPQRIVETCREATEWVNAALLLVKTAPDNSYKDDEEIAKAILEGLEKKERARLLGLMEHPESN